MIAYSRIGFKRAVQYKRSLPAQSLKVIAEVEHRMSESERESANRAIQKLLPPAEQALEVGAKDVKLMPATGR